MPRLKIGIFDSGLGGLALANSIARHLPQYDYLYLGDTKRVPYGNRSQETIHEYVSQALDYLFQHDCQLIILACNTASAESLRRSQQNYLPKNYPDRRVLGVIIPTVEAAFQDQVPQAIGVLATPSTVESGAFAREILRQNASTKVVGVSAPLLVPIVENDGFKFAEPIIAEYVQPLLRAQVSTVLLGCTHYCLLKDMIREAIPVKVISQDEVIPEKLKDYLERHPEIAVKLGQNAQRQYCITDFTPGYLQFVKRLVGFDIQLTKVSLS